MKKPDYKKIAAGIKKFKKDFPNGTVFKSFNASPPLTETDHKELKLLFDLMDILSIEGAKKIIPLLVKHKEAISPIDFEFAFQVFTACSDKKPFESRFELEKILKPTHSKTPLLKNNNWVGDKLELLEFLCLEGHKNNLTIPCNASSIFNALKTSGYDYSLRHVQRVFKSYSDTKR